MKHAAFRFLLLGLLYTQCQLLAGQTDSNLPGLLVSTAWLEENLEDPSVVILHYGKPEDFEKGHIPGAQLVSMKELMVDIPDGPGHELPDSAALIRVFSSWGIHSDSKIIICYGEENGIPMAARLFFTLDYAGLGNRTAILNGGLPAWKEEKRARSQTPTQFDEGNLRIDLNEKIVAHREDVLKYLEGGLGAIVDARPEAQYSGSAKDQNSKRKGHIPGAVNIPFSSLTMEDSPSMFRETGELRNIFENNGIGPGTKIIVYCGSGIWASPVYFTARLLGYPVRLYDASMQEWGNDDSLPMTTNK